MKNQRITGLGASGFGRFLKRCLYLFSLFILIFSVAALLSCRYSVVSEDGVDFHIQEKNEDDNAADSAQEIQNVENNDSYEFNR